MTIKEFIKESFKEEYGYCIRPKVICNDGFSISVQGSASHYCRPRKTQDWYDALELGYPSEEELSIMEYAENKSTPTDTVYSCVPIEVIEEIIIKHNGVNIIETFKK